MELLYLGISFLFFWIVYFEQQKRNRAIQRQVATELMYNGNESAESSKRIDEYNSSSDLLEDVPVSMRTIQAALYTFIAPYTNKRCFFGTPATTHFVYLHVNPRANVIRARYQAHTLNTNSNTRNIHVITGLQL